MAPGLQESGPTDLAGQTIDQGIGRQTCQPQLGPEAPRRNSRPPLPVHVSARVDSTGDVRYVRVVAGEAVHNRIDRHI
jgi:hypothetical protein